MEGNNYAQQWQRAVSFAAKRHEGQLRKDGPTPYFAHTARVAFVIRHVFESSDETALAAVLLLGLIEDPTTAYDDLVEQFGRDVADAVVALTKEARLPEPDREEAYDRQLSKASWQARLVKLAHVYDNYCDAKSEAERQRFAEKTKRAIRCAGDTAELQKAVSILRSLING